MASAQISTVPQAQSPIMPVNMELRDAHATKMLTMAEAMSMPAVAAHVNMESTNNDQLCVYFSGPDQCLKPETLSQEELTACTITITDCSTNEKRAVSDEDDDAMDQSDMDNDVESDDEDMFEMFE
jgi:hypothetical protein